MHVKQSSKFILKDSGFRLPSSGQIIKDMKKIKKNTIVVFDKTTVFSESYDKYYAPTFEGKTFIFLGEVPNAPGHCILADLSTGLIIGMYHIENFRKATQDEC